MGQSYVGEIRPVAFSFAPSGWALCQGQLLAISQFDTLFTLIGTTYGGDGQTTFGLPDLRGRTPIHFGVAPGGSSYSIGLMTGQENVTLISNQVASHQHGLNVQTATGNAASPSGAYLAGSKAPTNYYSTTVNGVTAPVLLPATGGNQPHSNLQPYLCLNYAISLYGIFPSRN